MASAPAPFGVHRIGGESPVLVMIGLPEGFAARPDAAGHLAYGLGGGGQVVEHHVRECGVDLGVLQGELAHVAAAQFDTGNICTVEVGSRGLEHAGRIVDGNDMQSEAGEFQREYAGSGADISHRKVG